MKTTLLQISTIIALAIGLALSFNANRPGALPLVYAKESQVKLDSQQTEISIKDAALLFVSKRAVFLDARDPQTYAEKHIQGAISLTPDYFEQDAPKIIPQLAGKVVITYCDGELCHLSHDLAELLKSKGVPDVYVLKNGWTLWTTENLPVTTGNTP